MTNIEPSVSDDTVENVPKKVEEENVETEAKEGEQENEKDKGEGNKDEPSSPDPYYPPIIYLPEVVVNSGEDGEVEKFKRRAKLYRYAHECSPPEWKERGTGDVKILLDEENFAARIIMRRDKTLKVCANHTILPWMDLKPNCGNTKSWVWKTLADHADEEAKQETLAIRFGTEENAKKFEEAFKGARQFVLENHAKQIEEEEGVRKKDCVKEMKVNNGGDTKEKDNKTEKQEKELSDKLDHLQV
jgi:Ran-binding protein 1